MIGQKIQNYEIKSHLGEGGMGTVFRAGDSVLDREVALKMLHAPLLQQPLFLERFKKEARVLAQLLHPNIAVIYNMIEQDNNHYMVMEYVEGKNLDALLRQYGTLSYKIVVPVFIQALEGLHHAHKKGIYHRDIKPSNLILTPDGTVKLMDFGIAMVAGEQRLTQVNRVVGTVEYIAPELIQGKEPSMSTDLYAIGVTMYELLTGKLPFEGNTDYNLMQDVLKKKPLSVDKMNASVPKVLSNLVMKTLEKKPGDRFANAKEFQQALIAAFPELKSAELTTSYINSAVVSRAQPTIVEKGLRPKPTVVYSNRSALPQKTLTALVSLKEKIAARENRLVVFSVSAVVLTVLLVLLFMPSNTNETRISSVESADPKTEVQQKKQEPVMQQQGESSNTNQFQKPNNPVILPPTPIEEEKKEPEKKKEEKKKDEPVKKDETKKEEQKPTDEEKRQDEKKNQPVREEKKEESEPVERRAPKTISLNSSVNVNLYLLDPINAETVKTGQSLRFSVTNAVSFRGDVIVERGATARGRIVSVGKKKISLVITSVTAANGQSLPVVEEELSGRIEDIVSARNYSATIKKGITINF